MSDKKVIFNGVIWSAVDKLSVIGIQIVLEIILARLLLPADFGIIGMAVIFISIGQVFVNAGFSDALIQKQDRSEIDFSTAFYINLSLSLIFYIALFFSAPFIANFFHLPILKDVVRMGGLTVIITSLALVHKTKLTISLNFKTQAKYSFSSVLISGLVGVVLAYCHYGVWALVYQSLTQSLLNTVFYWVRFRWLPMMVFSRDSFNRLFHFGSKLLVAGLIQALYQNMYSFVIGRRYRAADLGLFAKAGQFTLMP
ncbi:MAG: lipopolysaccharide biosynthesis protein, partial [Niabella sp.]